MEEIIEFVIEIILYGRYIFSILFILIGVVLIVSGTAIGIICGILLIIFAIILIYGIFKAP